MSADNNWAGLPTQGLFVAARDKDFGRMQRTLKADSSRINELDTDGWGLLHYLAADGRPETNYIDLLVEHKADVNLRNKPFKETPLIIACVYDNPAAAERLIRHGAKANVTDWSGQTPLSRAAEISRKDLRQRMTRIIKAGLSGAASNKSNSAEELRQQGNAAFRAKDYASALRHYSSSLEVEEDHRTFSNRAACLLEQHEFKAAISDAARAVELCPSFEKAWYRKIKAYCAVRDFPRALMTATRGLEHCPAAPTLRRIASALKLAGVPDRICIRYSLADNPALPQAPAAAGMASCPFCLRHIQLPLGEACPKCACDPRLHVDEASLHAVLLDPGDAPRDKDGARASGAAQDLGGAAGGSGGEMGLGDDREAGKFSAGREGKGEAGSAKGKSKRMTSDARTDAAGAEAGERGLAQGGGTLTDLGLDQESWMSVFGSMMPFASPLQFVNRSGICATTRMLQLRASGVSSCSVRSKVQELAVEDPDPYAIYRGVVAQVDGAARERAWEPVLWAWEVVKGGGKTQEDLGGLVFADMTTTRLLVVEVFRCDCLHVEAKSKPKANALFNLLKYLGYQPKLVLYSGVSARFHTLHPDLLALLAKPSLDPDSLDLTSGCELWNAITEANFAPALSASVLSKIDMVVGADQIMSAHVEELRREARTSKEQLRAQLAAEKPRTARAGPSSKRARAARSEDAEDARAAEGGAAASGVAPLSMRSSRLCDNCGRSCSELGVASMQACSRCRMAFYCSAQCQHAKWKLHKPLCKPAQP